MNGARTGRALDILVLAVIAGILVGLLVLAFGGFAKATPTAPVQSYPQVDRITIEDYYDENGNQITEEEWLRLYGGGEPEVAPETTSNQQFFSTPGDSAQDGF